MNEVAYSVLIISLVSAVGLGLGNLRFFKVHLGVAGILFAGLLFGHFGVTLSEPILEFVREFGLVLFVYAVGTQVGPGFLSSLRREGLPLNLMAAGVVLLGVAITLTLAFLKHIPIAAAVGMLAGATTNTPSLASAQQALKELPTATADLLRLPALGYAVSYPFGIVGIILTMLFSRFIFRVDPKKEAEALARLAKSGQALSVINLEVTNPNLAGLPLKKVPALSAPGAVVSRVLHDGKVRVAHPDAVLAIGDVLLAVGPAKLLEDLKVIVGKESGLDLRTVPSDIVSRHIIVTRRRVLGKSIDDLDLEGFGVTVTRVVRTEVEFTARADFRLRFGDALIVVGEEEALEKAAAELGNSPKSLTQPQLAPVFVGIALGVLLGQWPVHFSGVPAPVRLGLAGGPLLTAILLSWVGRIGPLVWYMPASANAMLRETGIALFLACVGLRSGSTFVDTLLHGGGLAWMGWSVFITLVPLLAVSLVARFIYKINFVSLSGLLAGAMTDPPALAFANRLSDSDAPSMAYATVYPLTMILRVISAQLIVLFFLR